MTLEMVAAQRRINQMAQHHGMVSAAPAPPPPVFEYDRLPALAPALAAASDPQASVGSPRAQPQPPPQAPPPPPPPPHGDWAARMEQPVEAGSPRRALEKLGSSAGHAGSLLGLPEGNGTASAGGAAQPPLEITNPPLNQPTRKKPAGADASGPDGPTARSPRVPAAAPPPQPPAAPPAAPAPPPPQQPPSAPPSAPVAQPPPPQPNSYNLASAAAPPPPAAELGYGGGDVPYSPAPARTASAYAEPPSAAASGQPISRARATTQADHEERVVGRAVDPGAELPAGGEDADLPAPEPLAPVDAKDPKVQELVDLFGEHLTRCLYSRVWSLRQHAHTQITEMLPQLQGNGRAVVHATCRIVTKGASDKMVQVYLAAMGLFTALFSIPAVKSLPRNEWSQLTAPLTPLLLAKLGDGNHRVKDASEASLLATCRLPQLGPLPVMQALLLPLNETKEKDARLMLGRLGLTLELLVEFVETDLRDSLRDALKSLRAPLESSKDTVRAAATEVAKEIYRLVGDLGVMLDWVGKLKVAQTIRDNLVAALEESAPAGGASPRQQQPPSYEQQQPRRSGPPTAPPSAPASVPHDDGYDERYGEHGGEVGDEGDVPDVPPFTCQFCFEHNAEFTEERLDIHYFKDCPMLCSCEQCGQIVEVSALNDHLVEECDQNQTFRYQAPLGRPGYTGCPMCGTELSADPEERRRHLVEECAGNPRRSGV